MKRCRGCRVLIYSAYIYKFGLKVSSSRQFLIYLYILFELYIKSGS